jgi:hypothetical protein
MTQPGWLLDRRVRILLEVAQEPARGDPRVTAGILPGDERGQLEWVPKTELREVSRSGYGHEDVPALQRPLETRVGALRVYCLSKLSTGRATDLPKSSLHISALDLRADALTLPLGNVALFAFLWRLFGGLLFLLLLLLAHCGLLAAFGQGSD